MYGKISECHMFQAPERSKVKMRKAEGTSSRESSKKRLQNKLRINPREVHAHVAGAEASHRSASPVRSPVGGGTSGYPLPLSPRAKPPSAMSLGKSRVPFDLGTPVDQSPASPKPVRRPVIHPASLPSGPNSRRSVSADNSPEKAASSPVLQRKSLHAEDGDRVSVGDVSAEGRLSKFPKSKSFDTSQSHQLFRASSPGFDTGSQDERPCAESRNAVTKETGTSGDQGSGTQNRLSSVAKTPEKEGQLPPSATKFPSQSSSKECDLKSGPRTQHRARKSGPAVPMDQHRPPATPVPEVPPVPENAQPIHSDKQKVCSLCFLLCSAVAGGWGGVVFAAKNHGLREKCVLQETRMCRMCV